MERESQLKHTWLLGNMYRMKAKITQLGFQLVEFPTPDSCLLHARAVADPEGVPRVPWNPPFKENQKMYLTQTAHSRQESKLHV